MKTFFLSKTQILPYFNKTAHSCLCVCVFAKTFLFIPWPVILTWQVMSSIFVWAKLNNHVDYSSCAKVYVCAMMGVIIIIVLSLQLMTVSTTSCTICSSASLLLIWSMQFQSVWNLNKSSPQLLMTFNMNIIAEVSFSRANFLILLFITNPLITHVIAFTRNSSSGMKEQIWDCFK